MHVEDAIDIAARWLSEAPAVLVGSGAGMGVDSGLGTYRGARAGVWGPLETLGIDYGEICTPAAFEGDNATLGWAFWRHSFDAYKHTEPHEGYRIVARWAARKRLGAFCYTTNVDGHWRRAIPEDRVVEVHGSTAYLQCSRKCTAKVWPCTEDLATDLPLEPGCEDRVVGEAMPRCAGCGSLARPNVLMFGDFYWCRGRAKAQRVHYKRWLAKVEEQVADGPPPVCLEIGAGTAVNTVRTTMEERAIRFGWRLIRINPENWSLPAAFKGDEAAVCIPLGALDALTRLDGRLQELQRADARSNGEAPQGETVKEAAEEALVQMPEEEVSRTRKDEVVQKFAPPPRARLGGEAVHGGAPKRIVGDAKEQIPEGEMEQCLEN